MAFPNQRPNAFRNRPFGTNQANRPPFRRENSNNSFSGRVQNQANHPPFRRENSNGSCSGRFQNQANNPPLRRENSNSSFSGRFQNQANNPPFRRENSNSSFSGRVQNQANHPSFRRENSNGSFSGRFQNQANHPPLGRENSNSSFSGRFQNQANHPPLRRENSNGSFSGRFQNQVNNPPLGRENSNSPRPFGMSQLHSSLSDVRVSSNSERFQENKLHHPHSQHQTRQVHHPPPKCASQQFGYECGQLLDCLKAIQAVLQCYECHKPLTSARTCLNGHGICSNCRTRCNKNCPICHAVILDLKPIMLNEIIKLLPKQCRNSTKGCELMVLAKDCDHEKFCRFRNTDCRFPSCDWEGMAKDLLLHLEKFHGKEMIRVATETQILMNFNTTVDREGLAVIVAFNNIFWRHVRVEQNQLIQFYQYIPMEKPKKEYLVTVEYHTPKTHFKKVVPVHTDVFDRNQLYNDPESFRLPKKVAKSFNQFHSGVHFNFTISQTDI